MGKIRLLLLLMFFMTSFVHASTGEIIDNSVSVKIQKEINEIGFNILNSNAIEKRMVFYYDISKKINASTYTHSRSIVMYRGLYNILQGKDEVASVLAHEISHAVDSYDGIFRGAFQSWASSFAPKKYEYKADKRAIDYMVNAGYHPVAFIVAMNKFAPQGRYDWLSTHPLTSRRMMEVYEYIYKKYPEYLVNNPYKNDIYYQNFLLTSKQNRKELQKKIETKSKKTVKYL